MVADVDADDAPTVPQETHVLSLHRGRIEVVAKPAAHRRRPIAPSTPRTDAARDGRGWRTRWAPRRGPREGDTSKNARCTVVVRARQAARRAARSKACRKEPLPQRDDARWSLTSAPRDPSDSRPVPMRQNVAKIAANRRLAPRRLRFFPSADQACRSSDSSTYRRDTLNCRLLARLTRSVTPCVYLALRLRLLVHRFPLCSRRLPRGLNRGRRGDAGEKKKTPERADPAPRGGLWLSRRRLGEHVVNRHSDARGEWGRRRRADDPEDVPEARGEQFFARTTDMGGEGSVAAAWTVAGMSRRRTETILDGHRTCGVDEVALLGVDGPADALKADGEHILDGHLMRRCERNRRRRMDDKNDKMDWPTEHVLDGRRTCEVNEASQPRGCERRTPLGSPETGSLMNRRRGQ